MTNPALPVVLVFLILIMGAYLMANQASLDLAGPLRNWLWERDVRRMSARGAFPPTIERSYWSAREYQRDQARLERIGYAVVSQTESDPYITLPMTFGPFGRGQQRQPARRRVPAFHVIYEHRATPPRA
jgi:hypothetical protein